ncbi:histidinol phosphatase [Muricauda sp. JGD-17]|uniref:protein-tyrosine-phosphatase n=1 Tax=Flagellimonas ochracea TaxID=2696472 RepID=A0A964TAE0_9FLAO|nr:CpsB/CapC family capsule biosynthesis tyrosine phosphatase [Allomuricauda ochracea]NAY91212.1 histidinol phosphatase [Allomuricauda ochracea]
MFHFFERKRFLVDYLHGFVDIHNHVLPGIDDGAKTVDESLELVNGFAEFGLKTMICTPHIMHNYYDNTPETITQAHKKLITELSAHDVEIEVDFAAEHMIDDNFETILESEAVMPLKKEYLLIEMSYLQPSFNFDMAIDKIAKQGYFPILAHPERYTYYHNQHRVYSEFKSRGILFQMNLLSLGEFYGKKVKATAEKLLKDGVIEYVGTDVHNIRQLASLKEMKIEKKNLKLLLPVIENTILTFY